jgi:diamine N-acetyltransferase
MTHTKLGVTFVQATPADLDELLPWIQAYYLFDEIPFVEANLRRGLAVLLQDRSLGGAWLVQHQQQTVGYFVLTFGFDLEFGGRQATLTELYLDASSRHHGLGAATLAFVEETLVALGVHALELQVEADNIEARAFYQRAGFTIHDRIPMSKTLTSQEITS